MSSHKSLTRGCHVIPVFSFSSAMGKVPFWLIRHWSWSMGRYMWTTYSLAETFHLRGHINVHPSWSLYNTSSVYYDKTFSGWFYLQNCLRFFEFKFMAISNFLFSFNVNHIRLTFQHIYIYSKISTLMHLWFVLCRNYNDKCRQRMYSEPQRTFI